MAPITKLEHTINKLVTTLEKYGIAYSPTDGEFNNVVFSKDGVTLKIYYDLFYRVNGQSVYRTNDDKTASFTDEMFYDWLKMVILIKFNINTV
jgi:hypothetical protein